MRILVIRFSSLGDVVLAAGPLRALAGMPQDAEVTLVTKEAYAPLFNHFDLPVEILAAPAKSTLTTIRKKLRERRFDWIIDLHGSTRSRLLTRMLHTANRSRIAKNVRRRRNMVRYKTGLDTPISTLDVYFDALRDSCPGAARLLPRLNLSGEERNHAARLRSESSPCIGLGWGARWPTKYVPPDLWGRLLEELPAGWPGTIRVFGLRSDRATIDHFVKESSARYPNVTLRAECGHALRDVMTRLSACDVFVSSDSGLMHVAAALDVPAFGLFGPTHPSLGFAPAGELSRAFHTGIWCSPCHRHGAAPCHRGQRFCFDEFDVRTIAEAIVSVIDTKGTPHDDNT